MNESNTPSRFDAEGLRLARTAATESMVLLRNEQNVLPLDPSQPVALFGRAQFEPFYSGGGAASMWHIPGVSFAEGICEAGSVYTPLLNTYRAYAQTNIDAGRNVNHFVHSLAEVPLTEQDIEQAAQGADTAIFFLSRFTRETVDLADKPGDYRVTEREWKLMKSVCQKFTRSVLVLNLAGLMDLSFLRECPFDAILYAGLPGMEAGHALADLLYGAVTPSGRLPDSWAETLACYPGGDDFSSKKIVYAEGIYMGYRYFDTFDRPVLFPFGFGLSYTDFSIETQSVSLHKAEDGRPMLSAAVRVTNTGKYAGKEVVQCYISFADGELDQPARVLAGFDKTSLLSPGESTTLTILVDLFDFASYRERDACAILEAGDHVMSIGRHSRDAAPVTVLRIDETIIVRRLKNRIAPKEAIQRLKKASSLAMDIRGLPILTLVAKDYEHCENQVPTAPCADETSGRTDGGEVYNFADLLAGRCTPEELAHCLPDEELSLMLTGDGGRKRVAAGLENRPIVPGEGSHSHGVPDFGIPSTVMQDGPNGLRLAAYDMNPIPPLSALPGTDCIGYPCSTLIAASWDRTLARTVAAAIGRDMTRYGVEGWCAPSVNLHRDPRNGRNFEYFSEDPFLTAEMAIAEITGMQEDAGGHSTGRYAIIKHLACNESEMERKFSDSVLAERTARDLYLKPFELAIRHGKPLSIMTSYNLINGVYASANAELLEGICREEWGYDGWIMTDWDVTPDASECTRNGIDIEMPGRLISSSDWEALGITREMAVCHAGRLLRLLARIKA